MPMRVQNHEPNTTVFSKMVDGNLARIIFAPKGVQGDLQRVPDAFADDIDFLASIDQKVLEVIDAPAEIMAKIRDEMDRSTQDRQGRLASQAADIESVMDRKADASMLGYECIAPKDGRPDLKCGRGLIMKRTEVNDRPPLCDLHAGQANLFYLAEAGSKGWQENGASETTAGVIRREWKKVEMNPVARVSD